MEFWKVVKGSNAKLFVSDLGRVKSVMRNPDGIILKTQIDGKGYERLTVTIDRVKHTFKIHRLVAEHFVDNPSGKDQVNHINGNKLDNRACNLEWVTGKENAQHAVDNGLWHKQYSRLCVRNNAAKKPVIATNIETGTQLTFNSVSEAERYFDSRHISAVLKGKRAKAKGHTFQYVGEGGGLNVITGSTDF
jgi:hypothetical protein